MLVRTDLLGFLKQDPSGLILRHFYRAVKIRVRFNGLSVPHSDRIIRPTCHEVARAYAQAFDVKYEDGLALYVSQVIDEVGGEFALTSACR